MGEFVLVLLAGRDDRARPSTERQLPAATIEIGGMGIYRIRDGRVVEG